MKRKAAGRPRVPLLTVTRESTAPPAFSPEATLGELADLASAVARVVDPVANVRGWLAAAESVARAATNDPALRPSAQLCIEGVTRVHQWLSRAALTGAEIATAMQDAAELAGTVEALRVEPVVIPKAKGRTRPSTGKAQRRARERQPAKPRTDGKWASLAALAKVHSALGRTRDEILADLSKRSGMRAETIARHEAITPHLPPARVTSRRAP